MITNENKNRNDEYLLMEEAGEYAYLEIGDVTKIRVENPLLDSRFGPEEDKFVEEFVGFCRKPENFWFTAKNILNIDLLPIQLSIVNQLWTKQFPMLIATRGFGKSYLLAVYIILRALLDQGSRIVVVGAALRQSMIIFNYILNIWEKSPILQDICGGKKNGPKREVHMAYWKLGQSTVQFLPLGNGETIRGVRADVIVCDEFSSISPDIFETVIRGFAAVKSQGLVENVKQAYKVKMFKEMGLISEEDVKDQSRLKTTTSLGANQIIISGTTSFQFNHFYKYFRYYKAIIESGGDEEYLRQNYPDITTSKSVDPREFSIIRIPYSLAPLGAMDDAVVSQGRSTMNSTIFDMEYGCVFATDSDGFYPASTIYACTCPVNIEGQKIDFSAELHGSPENIYVMGIDPASEKDNFAINIIELYANHRRVVYQWTTNRKKYQEMKERGLVPADITDYHTFCIKQIRSLMRRFNIVKIVCDAGGGGLAIKEGLQDIGKLGPGDKLIFDADDTSIQAGQDGLYILTMIYFQNADWRKSSHYALQTDFQNKKILFSKFDNLKLAENEFLEKKQGITPELSELLESTENNYLEIEELKREIILIKHESTFNGGEKWDVPKLKVHGSDEIKKQLKKDRFTSLLLSNWGARLLEEHTDISYQIIGGAIGHPKTFGSKTPAVKDIRMRRDAKPLMVPNDPNILSARGFLFKGD